MRILIGVDGSPGSLAAVDLAGRLLADDDEIALYFSPAEMVLRGESTPGPEMLERARQALANAVFDESRQHLPEALRGRTEVILGTQSANRGLVAAAQHWRAEVVCVGARGLGPIKTLVLGSVAHAVAQAVHVPVLVVRPTAAKSSLNVLLGYDESNSARQAEVMHWFSLPQGSKASVIAVVDAMPKYPPWLEQKARSADAEAIAEAFTHEHEKDVRRLREQLVAFLRQLPPVFAGSEPIVAEGYPSEEIIKTAEQTKSDLIVVGKTSRTFYQRFVLGSTSEAVLSHAPCSVLVVPMGEHP